MTGKKPFLAKFARVPLDRDATSRPDNREGMPDMVAPSRQTPRPRPTRITAVGGETTDDN